MSKYHEGIGANMYECSACEKKFVVMSLTNWLYKSTKTKKKQIFCSYKCWLTTHKAGTMAVNINKEE